MRIKELLEEQVTAGISEGPSDWEPMNLDQAGKQKEIDYFYKEHAPKYGNPRKVGTLAGHDVVAITKDRFRFIFLVNSKDQAVFYMAIRKMPDGVFAVGNVRSNGTVKATDVYNYLVNKYKKLYSDKHQTPEGRKIWDNLAKYYPNLKIVDTGPRFMATVNDEIKS
jgi:hypothetical protein